MYANFSYSALVNITELHISSNPDSIIKRVMRLTVTIKLSSGILHQFNVLWGIFAFMFVLCSLALLE
jgi:hypothetical protein